jgi:hypothetical protein
MPSIGRAKDILKGQEIEFLFASNEEDERIQSFRESYALNLNFVRVENIEELNIQALPTTFIISPSGNLALSETGFRNWDDASNIELITKIINSNDGLLSLGWEKVRITVPFPVK